MKATDLDLYFKAENLRLCSEGSDRYNEQLLLVENIECRLFELTYRMGLDPNALSLYFCGLRKLIKKLGSSAGFDYFSNIRAFFLCMFERFALPQFSQSPLCKRLALVFPPKDCILILIPLLV